MNRMQAAARLSLAILSLSGLGWSQEALELSFPDFSATQVIMSAGTPVKFKVYRLGDAVRVEINPANATVYKPGKNRVYRFSKYPNGKTGCVVMTLAQAQMLPSPLELLFGTEVLRTPAGTEQLDGHSCKVEEVEVTRPDKIMQSKVWLADDLQGIPVKIQSQLEQTKLTATYRDITIGNPDPELFKVPADCTPVEQMGTVVEDKTPN